MRLFAKRFLILYVIVLVVALVALCSGHAREAGVLMAGGLPLAAGGALTQQMAQALATWDGGNWSSTTPAASFTLTPVQMLNGSTTFLTLLTGIGSGFNVTTPTAQALVLQFKQAYGHPVATGSTWIFELSNQTGQTATLTAGTGVTINGTATVATIVNRSWLCTVTNPGDSLGNNATITVQNLSSRSN